MDADVHLLLACLQSDLEDKKPKLKAQEREKQDAMARARQKRWKPHSLCWRSMPLFHLSPFMPHLLPPLHAGLHYGGS